MTSVNSLNSYKSNQSLWNMKYFHQPKLWYIGWQGRRLSKGNNDNKTSRKRLNFEAPSKQYNSSTQRSFDNLLTRYMLFERSRKPHGDKVNDIPVLHPEEAADANADEIISHAHKNTHRSLKRKESIAQSNSNTQHSQLKQPLHQESSYRSQQQDLSHTDTSHRTESPYELTAFQDRSLSTSVNESRVLNSPNSRQLRPQRPLPVWHHHPIHKQTPMMHLRALNRRASDLNGHEPEQYQKDISHLTSLNNNILKHRKNSGNDTKNTGYLEEELTEIAPSLQNDLEYYDEIDLKSNDLPHDLFANNDDENDFLNNTTEITEPSIGCNMKQDLGLMQPCSGDTCGVQL